MNFGSLHVQSRCFQKFCLAGLISLSSNPIFGESEQRPDGHSGSDTFHISTPASRKALLRTPVHQLPLSDSVKEALYAYHGGERELRLVDILLTFPRDVSPTVKIEVDRLFPRDQLLLGMIPSEIEAFIEGRSKFEAKIESIQQLGWTLQKFMMRHRLKNAADLAAAFTVHRLSIQPGIGVKTLNEFIEYAKREGHPLAPGESSASKKAALKTSDDDCDDLLGDSDF